MKLTFKDLKQQKFVIEAEPSETVLEVKSKIFNEKGTGWEVAQQKLIYSGKILQDQNTVESYNIEEKGFIVCMLSKPKNSPAGQGAAISRAPNTPAGSSSAPATSAPPAPGPVSSSVPNNPPATPSPAPPASLGAAAADAQGSDPSALLIGGQREAAIANMESMGFPRAEVDRAMRAAFFNPDRAVEYLLNVSRTRPSRTDFLLNVAMQGIPQSVEQEERQAPQAAASAGASTAQPASAAPATGNPTVASPSSDAADQPINLFEAAAQAGRGSGGARQAGAAAGGAGAGAGTGAAAAGAAGLGAGAAAGGAGGLGNLDFLRQNPQFQQLRQVVQQQPQMLEPILQQVGAGNPQLAQLIGQNPDQFLQLLSEDVFDDDAPLPPGAQSVSVTEEEREAIERLCRLGFERDLVIQAYFACDKNEELAANFLFDQPDEPDDH
ncbi:MAG: hypothetical protein M1832_004708 [Thelocarpon impressellum]|nr:MAG: hypothetical protein M1832_004708 [Thelocarpon impressellum]